MKSLGDRLHCLAFYSSSGPILTAW
jgi:hypothetical protein